ncbi:MAG: hypothetical protein Q7U05_07025 [Polaromonas sp.]|nr:hypothetical protein [Polaromonas sp.]
MAGIAEKRGRGRPPKSGSLAEMRADFDRLLSQTNPDVLNRGRGIFGDASKNDITGNPAQDAETLSRDRAQMLKAARPARARKRPEAERQAILARAERLAALTEVIRLWPHKSASNIAEILHSRKQFEDKALRTLRQDIAEVRKLAVPVK